jgi:hypothetical protein
MAKRTKHTALFSFNQRIKKYTNGKGAGVPVILIHNLPVLNHKF